MSVPGINRAELYSLRFATSKQFEKDGISGSSLDEVFEELVKT